MDVQRARRLLPDFRTPRVHVQHRLVATRQQQSAGLEPGFPVRPEEAPNVGASEESSCNNRGRCPKRDRAT